MSDPHMVHIADQNIAASRDLGRRHGAYYRGARRAGAPRWLAAAVTLIDAAGDAMAHAAAADATAAMQLADLDGDDQ